MQGPNSPAIVAVAVRRAHEIPAIFAILPNPIPVEVQILAHGNPPDIFPASAKHKDMCASDEGSQARWRQHIAKAELELPLDSLQGCPRLLAAPSNDKTRRGFTNIVDTSSEALLNNTVRWWRF